MPASLLAWWTSRPLVMANESFGQQEHEMSSIGAQIRCRKRFKRCMSRDGACMQSGRSRTGTGTGTARLVALIDYMMRLSLTTALMGAALSQHPTADYWHHEHPAVQNAMWVFGTSGVSMYSVDGGTLLRSLPNTQICLEASTGSRGQVPPRILPSRHREEGAHPAYAAAAAR